jgi:hypothetical protein
VLAAVLFIAVLQLVRVEGAATCPAPAEVAVALARIATPRAGDRPRGVAELVPTDGAVRIVLYGPGGERLQERRLIADASCADLAAAAAVIIAAWERELGPRHLQPVRLASPPSTPLRERLAFDLAAGFSGALAGRAFAPGGSATLTLVGRRQRFGGRVELIGSSTRDQPLAPGHASYTRAQLQLGPLVRFRPRRLVLDLYAHFVAALTSLEGIGYSSGRREFDFDPGIGGGVRQRVRLGPGAPYLEAGFVGWLRQQQFQVTGVDGAGELPRLDLLFGAGLAIGRIP